MRKSCELPCEENKKKVNLPTRTDKKISNKLMRGGERKCFLKLLRYYAAEVNVKCGGILRADTFPNIEYFGATFNPGPYRESTIHKDVIKLDSSSITARFMKWSGVEWR